MGSIGPPRVCPGFVTSTSNAKEEETLSEMLKTTFNAKKVVVMAMLLLLLYESLAFVKQSRKCKGNG